MIDILKTALLYIVPFLFVLTLIVTIHELGHFWAARAFGVAVDRFSIGFGRAIASWKDKHGVEWRIGWIPLGGYVRFTGDENEASVPDHETLDDMRRSIVAREGEEGLRRYFHFKPVWQRAIVVAAGPIANFILAITIFSAIFLAFGEPYTPPQVHGVAPGSPAAAAGIRAGDMVVAVDGKPVATSRDLRTIIMLNSGAPLALTVERAGREQVLVATPARGEVIDGFGKVQKLGVLGLESDARIGAVDPSGPGAAAGFRVGDVVVAAEGRAIESFEGFRQIVAARPGKPLEVVVDRGGSAVTLTVTPALKTMTDAKGKTVPYGMIGLGNAPGKVLVRDFNAIEAVGAGTAKTWTVLSSSLHYLGRMITGRENADQIGGPLRMAQVSGTITKQVADQSTGWGDMVATALLNLVNLAAVLSVGIGFLNLLPIPVLDGGHLLFYAYEAVARRPLGAAVQAAGYRVGLALVLGLMLFATWNDLQQLRVFTTLGRLFS